LSVEGHLGEDKAQSDRICFLAQKRSKVWKTYCVLSCLVDKYLW
jgi:hypothetical protein